MPGSSSRIGLYADDHVSGTLAKIRGQFDTLGKNAGAKSVLQGVGIGAGISAYGLLQGAIGGVTSFLEDSVVKAREETVGIAQLDASLRANIVGWNGNRDAIEAVIKEREKLAFNDDQQREGLALLVASTHDVTKALDLQRIAMDLARLRGTDLVETSTLISKVYQGNLTSLKRFGISLGDVKNGTEAIAKIQKLAAGQAEAYGKTSQGAVESFNIAVGDLQEDMGNLVTGPLTDLVHVATDDVRAMQDLIAQANDLGDIIARLTGVTLPAAAPSFTDYLLNPVKATQDEMKFLHEQVKVTDDAVKGLGGTFDHGTVTLDEFGGAMGDASDATSGMISIIKPLTLSVDNLVQEYDDWISAMRRADDVLNKQKRGHEETRLQIQGVRLDLRDARGELRKLEDVKDPTLKQRISMNQLQTRILEDQDQLRTLKTDLQDVGKVSMKGTMDQIRRLGGLTGSTDTRTQQLVDDLWRAAHAGEQVGGTSTHKKTKGHAMGGVVLPGEITTVGEEGSETLIMGATGGFVIPHGGGGGGGGNHLHVHTVWPPTPQQIRQMADALDHQGYWDDVSSTGTGNRT